MLHRGRFGLGHLRFVCVLGLEPASDFSHSDLPYRVQIERRSVVLCHSEVFFAACEPNHLVVAAWLAVRVVVTRRQHTKEGGCELAVGALSRNMRFPVADNRIVRGRVRRHVQVVLAQLDLSALLPPFRLRFAFAVQSA